MIAAAKRPKVCHTLALADSIGVALLDSNASLTRHQLQPENPLVLGLAQTLTRFARPGTR
jgi:hypothetical protein